jgi:hypothetical protein
MKFIVVLFQTFNKKTKRVEFEAMDSVAATQYLETNYSNWNVSCYWLVWKPTPKAHVPLPNSFTHPLPQFNPNLQRYPLTV